VSGGRPLAGLALAVALAATAATAAPLGREAPAAPGVRGATPAPDSLDAARAAQAEAARHYRESLEALLPFREAAVERADTRVARDRELAARGVIATADVAASERALDEARTAADRTRAEIAQAAALATEAEAARELAALPPSAPGRMRAGATLIRHDGRAPWSLAELPALEQFFAARFHRALPVSARGQTPVHDRLGFNHHDALDVAVHPDSAEGRALMEYLRRRGIPFLAFRAAQPGAATGAHVHIGKPSDHVRGERGSLDHLRGERGSPRNLPA
jgi:hypothetical protein